MKGEQSLNRFFLVLILFCCTILLASCNTVRVPMDMNHNKNSMNMNVIPTRSDWKTPDIMKPNKKVPISIFIKDKTGQLIQKFDTVHEKKMHLIIVNKDLTYFSHIHPVYKGNGRFDISAEFPAGGDYKLISEFTPKGSGDNGVAQHVLHISGEKPAAMPIVPDTSLTKTINGKEVTLTFDHVMARMNLNMTFKILDAKTNKPARLQPYLGAMGHCVAISDDWNQYLHIHPMKSDWKKSQVTFMTRFPEKGTYKIWGQFQQDGQVFVVPFVVKVP